MSYSLLEAVPFEAETFKRGKAGWPVVVCQLVLNGHYKVPPLTLDGEFGPHTEEIAKQVQRALGILDDGIVGPQTQEAFVRAKCKHAESAIGFPKGLLIGLCLIESSYEWACVSPLNSNGTHDYGVTQWSLANPTEQQLRAAFDLDIATHALAGELTGFHNAFDAKLGNRRAWELAALNHNWPAAAYAIAEGRDAWLDGPEAWLTAKSFKSGREYADHYIAVARGQVTAWA